MDIWTSAYGIIDPIPVLYGEMSEMNLLSGSITTVLDLYREAFRGPYAIVSKIDEDQTLPTKDLLMMNDVLIARIPVSKEPNEQGGLTVTIGRS